MIAIIEQYWLNFLLGIISGGLILLCKKFYSLYQGEKNSQKVKEQDSLRKELAGNVKGVEDESKKTDELIQGEIDIMREGILSIQRKIFKQECRELLDEDHRISLDEFESIQEDHNIYNKLGGNHDGDALFRMVKEKATSDITEHTIKKQEVL